MISLSDGLPEAQPDLILKIMAEFRDDPRPDKVDLGVGVYRDETGETPVMRAVRVATERVLATETTKSYVALAGDPVFRARLGALALGTAHRPDEIASIATPGGTGALRQAFELVRMARPEAQFWISDPSWPNHATILHAMGRPARSYPYYDAGTGQADIDRMLETLAQLPSGDAVVLHACCHNPTGADLSPDAWVRVAEIIGQRGLLPIVDMAYLGLGDGIVVDSMAVERLAAHCPDLCVAMSGSKTFGLYRERVGALFVRGSNPRRLQGVLDGLNRHSYAFPPDHGARIVSTILGDPELASIWEAELSAMRARIARNRTELVAQLGDPRLSWIERHRGMFSRLPVTPDQVAALRRDHGVYVIGDGRVNLAGLTERTLPLVAHALTTVLT